MKTIRLTVAGHLIEFADGDAESIITAIRAAASGQPTTANLLHSGPIHAVSATSPGQHFTSGAAPEQNLADY